MKNIKFLIFVLCLIGYVFSGDAVSQDAQDNNTTIKTDSATVMTDTKNKKSSLSKTRGTIPSSKTNWSKIKDLFL